MIKITTMTWLINLIQGLICGPGSVLTNCIIQKLAHNARQCNDWLIWLINTCFVPYFVGIIVCVYAWNWEIESDFMISKKANIHSFPWICLLNSQKTFSFFPCEFFFNNLLNTTVVRVTTTAAECYIIGEE